MVGIPESNFNGTVSDISFHSLVYFDAAFVTQIVKRCQLDGNLSLLDIRADETYELVDWATREVVQRAFPELYVISHPHIDKFQQFYDENLFGHEFRLRDLINSTLSFKKPPKLLKVLPMNERSLIAVGM